MKTHRFYLGVCASDQSHTVSYRNLGAFVAEVAAPTGYGGLRVVFGVKPLNCESPDVYIEHGSDCGRQHHAERRSPRHDMHIFDDGLVSSYRGILTADPRTKLLEVNNE